MNVTSFLMVGVGGQGIVLASNVLCTVAMLAGYDVKKSEIHGMAQRGGSVVSHVRYGDKVYSPVIPEAAADYILSFEKMEFLRYLPMKNKKTVLILNTKKILSLSVALGTDDYPEAFVDKEKETFGRVCEFAADDVAAQAGHAKALNIVMLGKLSACLDIKESFWEEAIRKNIPQKNVGLNLRAFKMGREADG